MIRGSSACIYRCSLRKARDAGPDKSVNISKNKKKHIFPNEMSLLDISFVWTHTAQPLYIGGDSYHLASFRCFFLNSFYNASVEMYMDEEIYANLKVSNIHAPHINFHIYYVTIFPPLTRPTRSL